MASGMTPSQRITTAKRNQKYPSADFCNQRSNGLRFQTSLAIPPKNKKAPGITRTQNVTTRRVSDRCRIASPPTPASANSNPRRALFSRGELGTLTPHFTKLRCTEHQGPCQTRLTEIWCWDAPVGSAGCGSVSFRTVAGQLFVVNHGVVGLMDDT